MALDGINFERKEHEPTPEETKLADGSTIISAFLPDVPVLSHEQHEEASDMLRWAADAEPDLVKSCAGKTREEARAILAKYISKPDEIQEAA